MAVVRHSENIEVQDGDQDDADYENETTVTARRTNVEMSEEGHYERLDLHKIDDAVYGDLRTKNKLSDKSCPDEWMKFGERCYYRSTDEKTWEESRDYCVKEGADLVIINSDDKQKLIRRLSPGCEAPKDAWVGLNRTSEQDTWTWVDGSPQTTQFWGRLQFGNCAYYWYKTMEWYNSGCSVKKTRICEK